MKSASAALASHLGQDSTTLASFAESSEESLESGIEQLDTETGLGSDELKLLKFL